MAAVLGQRFSGSYLILSLLKTARVFSCRYCYYKARFEYTEMCAFPPTIQSTNYNLYAITHAKAVSKKYQKEEEQLPTLCVCAWLGYGECPLLRASSATSLFNIAHAPNPTREQPAEYDSRERASCTRGTEGDPTLSRTVPYHF